MEIIIFFLVIAAGVYFWLKMKSNRIAEKRAVLNAAKAALDNPNYQSVILNKEQDSFLAITTDGQIAGTDIGNGKETYPASVEAVGLLNDYSIYLYQIDLLFTPSNPTDAQKFYNALLNQGAKEVTRITPFIKISPEDAKSLDLVTEEIRFFHIQGEDKESVNDPIYITGLGYDKRWLTDIKIERKYQVQEDENHRVNYAILLLTIQDMNNKLYRIKVSTDQGTYNELNHYFLASNSFVKNQNNSSDNTKHELQNLKDLLDQGIITDEEFEAKKKAILGL